MIRVCEKCGESSARCVRGKVAGIWVGNSSFRPKVWLCPVCAYPDPNDVLSRYRFWAQVNSSNIRARKYGVPDTLTTVEWKKRLVQSNGRCTYCGTKVDPSKVVLDHIVPLSKGGSSSASNVTPACSSCNSNKNDRLAPNGLPLGPRTSKKSKPASKRRKSTGK